MKKLTHTQWKILIGTAFIVGILVTSLIRNRPEKAWVPQTPIKLNQPTPTEALIKYTLPDSRHGEPLVIDFNKRGDQADNYYFKLLKNRIESEHLSAQAWFGNKCNQFWLMDREPKYQMAEYQIERHAVQSAECYGVATLLDMFTIDKKTEEIYWLDTSKGQDVPFSEWAKTISKE